MLSKLTASLLHGLAVMTLALVGFDRADEASALTSPETLFRAKLVALLPRLRAFARLYCGNPDDADDAVQRTCLRALERWRQWSGEGPLEHWLTKILVNAWRSELRARKLRSGPPIDGLPEPADGAAKRLEDFLYLAQVEEEILRLAPDRRDVLQLIVSEGLSYRAAAETLGVPVGTVMSRLARARATLNARLGSVRHDEDGRPP